MERLREDLPVETLYSFEVLKGTTFVFRIIRDFLRAEVVEYNRHPATDRISWGLVKLLYPETEDIDFTYERLVQHKKSSRASMPTNKEIERQAGPPVHSYSLGRRDSEARAAHNMALRFKNQDKFAGKLGEDLPEHINNYIDAAQDYNLDQTNKLASFHNAFDRGAKRFYREKVRDRCRIFSEACQVMQHEYNSRT